MRRLHWVGLLIIATLAGIGVACSAEDPPGAGSAAQGGQAGSAGGNAGVNQGAGQSGAGGAANAAGAAGTAGSASGSAGQGGSGSGGASGAGGSDPGGGSSGSAGTGSGLDPSTFAPGLDGYLYTGECNGGSASFECPLSGCSGNVFNEQSEFTAGGDPQTVYLVTLHVYGVVELRSDYEGGTRRQGGSSNSSSNKDFWYEGGSYTPGDGYNVYGLRVAPAVQGVADPDDGGNNYFLNARDSSSEAHEVWELNYDATLRVQGGGSIEFTAYDPNCLQIMNNGETASPSGSGPDGALMVPDVENADPPPVDFVQPLSTQGRNGQWVYVDVLSVQAE